MGISYRFKKKEFILMLDMFGDAGSLEQKFGDVYISREEYDRTAAALHARGFVTVIGDTVSAEPGMEVIMKRIFSSKLVFAGKDACNWIYCSADLMIHVRTDTLTGFEYLVSVVTDDEDKAELTERLGGTDFRTVRGGSGEITGDRLVSFAEEFNYE